jgi:hypothetical protein
MKKIKITTTVLLLLLLIRLIFQADLSPIFFITAGIYLLAIVGILKKQKWALAMVIIIAIIDMSKGIAMFPLDAFFFGAITGDILLLYLSYKEYKSNFS